MHLTALRAAAIAGSCAVALSFVALPAHAVTVTSFSQSASEPSDSSPTTTPSGDDTGTPDGQEAGDDTGTGASDDGTEASDDGTGASGDDGSHASDDDGSGASDDDDSDDEGGDDGASAPVVLAAEQGTPTQTFRATVLLPKELRTKGIKVVYSGLTRKAHYQPYISNGETERTVGALRKANGKGSITVVIRPGKDLSWTTKLGASFTVGLRGTETQLDLTQRIEVKYDSDVALTTKRHGGRVALAVSVDHETASGDDTAWKRVKVHFQKKVHGRWVTVKTVRTDAEGVAKVRVKSGKSEWRAVVASGRTVAGTTTRSHRG